MGKAPRPAAAENKNPGRTRVRGFSGAADEARTRYLHLGKVALYQMSYGRISQLLYSETAKQVVPPIGIEPAIFAVTGRRDNRYTTGPTYGS